ncbi:FecR domain-containing protein [Halobacteriovorax sp. HLS]|uniref:FecR family protein n=1 Tax=Halobacteriovorax sp. HLS TaxID=2234000 RepID=UPI000FD8F767|nr:FecR family protein [Halobacteriovorax sp. HLS]
MTKLLKLLLTLTLIFSINTNIFAQSKGVAKAIILKGKVLVENPKTKELTPLKKGSWVKEGLLVKTQSKSFVKLLFIDKSQMNLGPKSEMVISKFPKNKAGIITLMKGSLRSKVTKNYLDIKDKDKSKLFIKTKTAAMGVRGTDFLVTYNPLNENTALITFSGAVAMAQINESVRNIRETQSSLERIVSGDTAVIVTKGQFSGVAPGKTDRATIPVKINPAQLETMKSSDGPTTLKDQTNTAPIQPKKKFRNVIPPGVDAKKFSNHSKVEDQVQKTIGYKETKEVLEKVTKTNSVNTAPPEGMVNKVTGEIAPAAGGFIDLNTAQYIPPPPGSAFDAVTQTYIPPSDMGGFHPSTGDFHHPEYQLTHDGKFIALEDSKQRAPASTDDDDGPINKPIDPKLDQPIAPKMDYDDNTAQDYDYNESYNQSDDGYDEGEVDLDEIKDEIDSNIEDATDARNDILNNSTRVKFNIN